jgi:hypothetical protein
MPFAVNDVVTYDNGQYKVIEVLGMGSYFYPGNEDPTRVRMYKLQKLDDPNTVVDHVFEPDMKMSGGRRRHRKTHRKSHRKHRKTHRRRN